jgi:hypothetical protein
MKAIALTSHAVNILKPTALVEQIEVKGRPAFIYRGKDLKEDTLVSITQSGLPIPQVKDTSAEVSQETLNIEGVDIEIEISSSAGKEIHNLPEAQEGVIYITSSFTANEALKLGRQDVYAPKQLVCILNEDGSTTIVGTLGLKKGG